MKNNDKNQQMHRLNPAQDASAPSSQGQETKPIAITYCLRCKKPIKPVWLCACGGGGGGSDEAAEKILQDDDLRLFDVDATAASVVCDFTVDKKTNCLSITPKPATALDAKALEDYFSQLEQHFLAFKAALLKAGIAVDSFIFIRSADSITFQMPASYLRLFIQLLSDNRLVPERLLADIKPMVASTSMTLFALQTPSTEKGATTSTEYRFKPPFDVFLGCKIR